VFGHDATRSSFALVLLDALLALLAMCYVERLCGVGEGHAAFVRDQHSRTGAETALDGSLPRCSAPRSRRG